MSWERVKYEVFCSNCDKKSFIIKPEDDGVRSSIAGLGDDNAAPSGTSVARRREVILENSTICECGSVQIETGKILNFGEQKVGLHS